MAVTFSAINELLASLNGEDSAVNNASRTRFINAAGADIYARKDFLWKRSSTTIALAADGTASLPADMNLDSFLDIREVLTGQKNDNIYQKIDITEKDAYTIGDFRFWITGNDGALTFNSTETDLPTLTVNYDKLWVDLVNVSDTCLIPRAMPIAAGAFVRLKRYDDPESDISQEKNDYEIEIIKLITEDDRKRGLRRFQGQTEKSGYYIGNVSR